MVKKIGVLLIFIGIFIIGCNQIQESTLIEKPMINEIEKDKEVNVIEKETIRIETINDWSIEIILCKECSPYRSENISQNELQK